MHITSISWVWLAFISKISEVLGMLFLLKRKDPTVKDSPFEDSNLTVIIICLKFGVAGQWICSSKLYEVFFD